MILVFLISSDTSHSKHLGTDGNVVQTGEAVVRVLGSLNVAEAQPWVLGPRGGHQHVLVTMSPLVVTIFITTSY